MLNIHWQDWCWSWSSSTVATWCEELTHWKRPWCWKRLKAKGEEGGRRWDGWMASLTQSTWIWLVGSPCSQGTLKSLLQHVVSGYYIEAVQFYKNHISNPKHLDKEWLLSKASSRVRKVASCLGVRKAIPSRTSLLAQCLRLHFQCRGHYFGPWSGN